LLSNGVPVFAQDSGPELTPEQQQHLNDRLSYLSNLVHEKIKNKVSTEELYAALAKEGVYPVGVQSVPNHKDKKQKAVKNENAESLITPMSNEDQCISLPTADLFWDSDEGYYFAYAFFFWNDEQWRYDLSGSVDVGGKDAFGLVFDRPIHRYTQFFQTWTNFGDRWEYSSTPQYASSYGVCFNKQDKFVNGAEYTWDSGMISIYMLPQQTGKYYFWQEMGHTWGAVDISSVSVSSSGISMTFTSGTSKWKAIAPYSGSHTF